MMGRYEPFYFYFSLQCIWQGRHKNQGRSTKLEHTYYVRILTRSCQIEPFYPYFYWYNLFFILQVLLVEIT